MWGQIGFWISQRMGERASLRHANVSSKLKAAKQGAEPLCKDPTPTTTPALPPVFPGESLLTRSLYSLLKVNQVVNQARKQVSTRPIYFDKNSAACQAWVQAHLEFCGQEQYEVAKKLLETVDFISIARFKQMMAEILADFKNRIGDRPFILVIDRGKSSAWIAELMKNELKGLNFQILDPNQLYFHLKFNSEVKDFVRLDDAIYSGVQMNYFSSEIRSAYEKANSSHRTNRNPRIRRIGQKQPSTTQMSQNQSLGKLHVLVSYSTQQGKERTLAAAKKDVFEIEFSPLTKELQSLENKIPDQTVLKTMSKMYPNAGPSVDLKNNLNKGPDWKSVANTFFEFKVPDGLSSIEDFFWKGEVSCKNNSPVTIGEAMRKVLQEKSNSDQELEKTAGPLPATESESDLFLMEGESSLHPMQFLCIPPIIAPYKKSAGTLHKLIDCYDPVRGPQEEQLCAEYQSKMNAVSTWLISKKKQKK